MRRLLRLLPVIALLLAMLPCEAREALGAGWGAGVSCCPEGEHVDAAGEGPHVRREPGSRDEARDCCGTPRCACALVVALPRPVQAPIHPAGASASVEPAPVHTPPWRAAPPPTPPPIG